MTVSRAPGGVSGAGIVQRISLAGAEEVKRLLDSMGAAGEKAAAQIGAAMAVSGGNTAALGTAVAGAFSKISAGANTLKPAHEAIREVETRFAGVGKSITAIGEVLLPDLVSKIGLGAGAIAVGVKEILGKASESIIALRNLSLESGLSVKTVQGLSKVFEENNISAEKLPLVLGKFAESLGVARLEAQKLEGPLGSPFDKAGEKVTTLRGDIDQLKTSTDGATSVFRGAVQQVRDTSTAFKSLGMDAAFLKRFPDTMEGNALALIEFSRRLGAVTSDSERARIGALEFGKGWKTTAAGILAIAPELEHAIGAVADKGLGVTDDDIHRALEYNKAVKELGDQWTRTIQVIGIAVFPFFEFLAKKTEESVQNMRSTFSAFGNLTIAVFQFMAREWGISLDGMKISADNFKAAVLEAFTALIPGLGLALKAIGIVQAALDRLRNTPAPDAPGAPRFGPPVASAPLPGPRPGFAPDATLPDTSSPASAPTPDYGDFSPRPYDPTEVRPVEDVNPDFVIRNGLAGGGQVRGMGFGDIVPAWLTPKEFVVKVAAVRKYGVDFMHRLNSMQLPKFGLGGLVEGIGRSAQHFSGGGMVGAGAGGMTAVHLHLDGGIYPMQAEDGVAEALTRVAVRRKILSGGRRPSWQT